MSCKRHNPVESICRKLQTIRMRDQVSNPMLQIPKFCSRNFDSPQVSHKKNMEVILKNRTMKNQGVEQEVNIAFANQALSPEITLISLGQPKSEGLSPTVTSTYTVISSTGDAASKPLYCRRTQTCSTPVAASDRNDAISSHPHSSIINIEHRFLPSADCGAACSPVNSTSFSFCTHLRRPDSPVAKKLSLADASGNKPTVSNRMENTEDASLICEEDLLDTIFYTCDVRHKGKVCVSKIVDYLRHTTSRTSDDSGLEDLCNMLDPDNKDVSIDLDTYRAVMKEWIEDCRRTSIHEEMEAVNVTEDLVQHHDGQGSGTKCSDAVDQTVGSLEAFGGEISRGDLETSDLISCIADLQYNHQKLQEHNLKLRLTIDAAEESNNRLMEQNEELLSQIKSAQQSILIEKSLKEDLEDLKLQISNLEETKERLVLQNKQTAKENQSLIQKIASLQEENLRNALDIEALREKIAVLSDEKTELQMQLTDLESLAHNKDTVLLERENHIKELKHSIVEYSMIAEGLRNEKSKLKNQLLMQQELASQCINTSLIPQDGPERSRAPSSLHSELLNAFEENSSEWSRISDCIPPAFEKMLDEEVLMLLQGPGPEQAALQFKAITMQMATEVSEEIDALVMWLKQVAELEINSQDLNGAKLEHLGNRLQKRRQQWLHNISVLEEQKSASDREYIQLASTYRRSKTEQLHFKRKEAARRQRLEAQKEATERAAAETSLQLQRVRQQLGALHRELREKDAAFASVQGRAEELRTKLQEEREHLLTAGRVESGAGEQLQSKASRRQTITQSPRERLFQQELCGLKFQTGSCCKEQRHKVVQPEGLSEAPRHTLLLIQQGRNHNSVTTHTCTPLLDALMLEHLNPFSHIPSCVVTASSVCTLSNTEQQKPMTSATDELNSHSSDRCKLNPDGIQLDVGLSVSGLSGELLTQAPADEGVYHDKLSPIGEDPDRHQLSTNRVVTQESSTMSNTSTKKTNKSPQHKEASKTPEGSKNHTNVGGVIKDCSLDGPLPSAGSQLSTESCASDLNQPELKSKIKINLEATRGSVAVDELSPCEVKLNPISPASRAEGMPKSQCQDLLRKASLQSAIASEQDVEAEFLRFSLAFKCDMFTLDKRLRLEERSRDLAETNLKKEIEKCQQALQTVQPLCEEVQSLEIFEKLEKSLGVLTQTITRVISRAEMLGAIHQETRVGKAVEVMIQYVENLKRMYAKEHAELEEMKQLLLQNGNTLNSLKEHQDEHRNKRFPTSQTYGRGSLRRVSIATIPRSNAGMQVDVLRLREIEEGRRKSEGDQDKLRSKFTRKMSSWKFLGQKPNEASKSRPSLHQFISTCTWAEKGSQLLNKGSATPELEVQEDEEKSETLETPILTEPENDLIASPCTGNKGLSPHLAELWNSFSKSNRGPWLPVILLFSLSVLGSFLIGWSLHTSVDAAGVGTGDSWKAIQQFLWPYTGLQHNGQPPV
ncbi:inositol 1,4,5-triphosphate receptor associated 2 isoform X2 [Pristis pectinata]|uniref:inositol 1,4,5-triphosphate receptor associated 2 isoform X2 n=1 Tax=Pristis pectinata TaxID=685728 RepID=UPI00223CDACD|nr:inositol 1,4,5-triphosphate receptor associated 2 isoform X2 [Pristis pectinata]